MTLKMVDTSFKSTKMIISDIFFKAIITTVKNKQKKKHLVLVILVT